ncbi:hypothetical protein JR536_002948 [Listeria monocytogenes]|uniref:hypothetical protein n=1 Tax=Listeria monocytogenes TaxID=1639 RepID=UPI00083DE07E|nr:hypothetical protein [Listeria monocytogenes]EAC2557534.1 hypothetical protein [Listeria monocytogenes]EAC4520860.1 hypothetical protein [Listeria monocytogenes]EAE8113437.1 hypothetical protein [Listeria monocytogenes]EAE8240955.1 hypothetical protein [Listeria monocytogenes]EAF0758322.1 hypothetical protein [Listeria monocytogenes]
MADKKMGFFGNTSTEDDLKPKKGFDKSYKPPITPKSPDNNTPQVQSNPTIQFDDISFDSRKTMRIPEPQFYEFQALLDVSEYSYVYELLGEMIDARIQNLDSSELRAYQSALELRRKKAIKDRSKKKK